MVPTVWMLWVPQFHLPPSHYTRTGVLRSTLCSDTPCHNISLFGIICILQTLVDTSPSGRMTLRSINIDSQVGNKQLTTRTLLYSAPTIVLPIRISHNHTRTICYFRRKLWWRVQELTLRHAGAESKPLYE